MNRALPWKVAEPNWDTLEGRRLELSDAEVDMRGSGVAEGSEEGIEQGFGEGGAAVIDVGAGGQASQVGVAVGVG